MSFQLLNNLTLLISDAFYIYPVYKALRKQFAVGRSPQYLYSFDYIGSFQYRIEGPVPSGVEHSDDKCFIFPNTEACCKRGASDCDINEFDSRMIDTVVDLWTSFASNG